MAPDDVTNLGKVVILISSRFLRRTNARNFVKNLFDAFFCSFRKGVISDRTSPLKTILLFIIIDFMVGRWLEFGIISESKVHLEK